VKYLVEVNGALAEPIEVAADGVGVYVDSPRATLTPVAGTPVWLLTLGSDVRRVIARSLGGGRYQMSIDGYRFEVEALDERARAIRAMAGTATGAAAALPVLKAPMPGLIVRVHVALGDVVVAGQALVVMEAMKMENELRAPAAGTVRSVTATPGTAVEKGAVLVELE
jgi:biotin carboxyl carrier protein